MKHMSCAMHTNEGQLNAINV